LFIAYAYQTYSIRGASDFLVVELKYNVIDDNQLSIKAVITANYSTAMSLCHCLFSLWYIRGWV